LYQGGPQRPEAPPGEGPQAARRQRTEEVAALRMSGAAHPREGGFPKSARLLHRREFLAVRQKGQGFAEGPLAASWLARQAGRPTRPGMAETRPASARVGLTVSSKVGGSVVRNHIKRCL